MALAFVTSAYAIGLWLRNRRAATASEPQTGGRIGRTIVGILILFIAWVVPFVGWIFALLAGLGAMTSEQVDLVRKSFDAIWPVHRKWAELFYSRFFELAPDARHLFARDMDRQQLKLIDMIAAIVGALDERELFHSLIRYNGRRHAQFGVQARHFDAFGEALIWSLGKQFGPLFTPAMKAAWIMLYDTVRSEMIAAACEDTP